MLVLLEVHNTPLWRPSLITPVHRLPARLVCRTSRSVSEASLCGGFRRKLRQRPPWELAFAVLNSRHEKDLDFARNSLGFVRHDAIRPKC